MMKKSRVFFCVGCIMLVIAIAFVLFALNHPEASFPWGNSITYIIYMIYIIITISMFVLWRKSKNK